MILPSLIEGMINVAGYASEIAIAFGQLSAFDFSGAIGTMENLGSTSEKWLANVEEARKRSREAAENAASDQEAARATPPVDQRAIADQQAKQEAAEKTIAQLERQLAVTIQGEDAIRRQEELAMATNDVERERIAILQQQIAAQEKQKELIEAQKIAEDQAAKDRQKMLEEQAKERDRIQGAISAFDPGVQAVQGRLLTRGDSDRSPEKIVKNTERAAGLLEAIQGLLERPPASSDQIVFEGVGA
jgi:flagellar biosynthesis GTPase FlhF